MLKHFIVILLIITPTVSFADVYKWTDENGAIHFSDNPNFLPEDAQKIIGNPDPPKVQTPQYKQPEKPKQQSFFPAAATNQPQMNIQQAKPVKPPQVQTFSFAPTIIDGFIKIILPMVFLAMGIRLFMDLIEHKFKKFLNKDKD